jgi:hypothetical protein
MNTVEEQVRSALRAHAETFSAHPQAWDQLRSRAVRRPRPAPRRTWPAKFMIPAAAAAAVVAIVVVASFLANGAPGPAGPGTAGRSGPTPASSGPGAVRSPAGPYSASGPASEMLRVTPPTSAIIGFKVPSDGLRNAKKAKQAVAYFWLGYNLRSYWIDQVTPGLQFCNDTVDTTDGESSGFCWPLPQLGGGQLASVTGSEGVGTDQSILEGAAARQVASVTAVLPDGHDFLGVVKTGRGFGVNAWTVEYPPSKGVRLVFRDASGNELANVGPSAPAGPPQLAQPKDGGVRVPGGTGIPSGTLAAYLVQGRVGFWSPETGGLICPVPASGEPALGGIALALGGNGLDTEAVGYAHADVARVVVRFPAGQVSARTFAAGWRGSDTRLWVVGLPASVGRPEPPPTMTVTGYDAAGHVVERVDLGSSEF